MEPVVHPLPGGDVPPPPYGPQEVIIFRMSDPVLVRRAGETSGYPLTVYQKQERLRSGASVLCAAGGRCELLWPDMASSVLIFDEGVCVLGEPSRDEPLVTFKKLTRSRVFLTPTDSVAIMGGALLKGDPDENSGPFLLDRVRDDVVKITNQSKLACTLTFREQDLILSPGEVMRLPLLEASGAPIQRDPAEVEVTVAGREVPVVGDVEVGPHGLKAKSEALVRDLGVTVSLGAGETVILDVFGVADDSAPAPPVDPGPDADPETGPGPDSGRARMPSQARGRIRLMALRPFPSPGRCTLHPLSFITSPDL